MNKLIGSTVAGIALVVALMLFVSPSLGVGPAPEGRTADPPPTSKVAPAKIEVQNRPDPLPRRARHVSLEGTIADLPTPTITGTWTITDGGGAAWAIPVTEETKIQPPHATPAEGDGVLVLGTQPEEAQNTLLATHIVIQERHENRALPVEFHGVIQELPVPTDTNGSNYWGTWVVADVTFTVDAKTMIHPPMRTPTEGMQANVVAFEQPDGSLWAKNIALRGPDEADDEVEIEGPIESLPDLPYIGTWVVEGLSVTVTDTTDLKGATPAVSLTARVKGQEQSDGSILAREILVKGPDQKVIEFEGIVHVFSDTRPSEWQIKTDAFSDTDLASVWVMTYTHINEEKGPVDEGVLVEVKALEQPDGSFVALLIKVQDGDGDTEPWVELEGTVVLTGDIPGVWSIASDAYTEPISMEITTDTIVIPRLASLTIDASVEVKAYELEGGTFRAFWIRVKKPESE